MSMYDLGILDKEDYYHNYEELTPHVDDIIWIDAKGISHEISKMDIPYVEACIRFLHKKGFKEMIPRAFFKRFNERHKVLSDEFEILGD